MSLACSATSCSMAGKIVLVPHPGAERSVARDGRCRWPRARVKHARKFVLTRGIALAEHPSESGIDGEFGVWCEYEANTTATPALGAATRSHAFDLEADRMSTPATRLNSDPWIWRPGFRWTVCRLLTKAGRNVVKQLSEGDIVIFGSSIGGRWRMDTVLVVRAPRGQLMPESPAHGRYVVQPLRGEGIRRHPVVGREWSPGTSEPFSFAPVQPSSEPAKPRVDVTSLLGALKKSNGVEPSPLNSQSLVLVVGSSEEAWATLTELTFQQGFLLGVSFQHPLDA